MIARVARTRPGVLALPSPTAPKVERARPPVRLEHAPERSLWRRPAEAGAAAESYETPHREAEFPLTEVRTATWEPAPERTISRAPAPAPPPPEPARATPTESSAPVVARQAAPEHDGATLARTSAPATIARSPGPSGGDDGYEDFIERLRRDLLREREQIGDLLGDTPW
jgi:hypothetical protein